MNPLIFFILTIVTISILFTVIYVYRCRTVWVRISDTGQVAGTIRFFDEDDMIQVYSHSKGKCVSFVCINHTEVAESTRIMIPSKYMSVYDFILSGDIDEEIRDLRMVAENKLLTSKVGHRYHGKRNLWHKSINKEHIPFRPLSFYDFKTLHNL